MKNRIIILALGFVVAATTGFTLSAKACDMKDMKAGKPCSHHITKTKVSKATKTTKAKKAHSKTVAPKSIQDKKDMGNMKM